MSPRPGGDVSNSAEFAVLGSGTAGTGERPIHIEASAIGRSLRNHPALVIALSYLAFTIVGVVHDVLFFHDFRIQILDYSDPQDLIFAPLRNPVAVPLSILPGLLLLWFSELRRRRKALAERSPRFLGARWRNPAWRLSTYGAFIFLYAVLFTQLYAHRMSNRVKAGRGQHVSFARTDGEYHPERPILLGSTAKFFFLYYPARRVTEIVPVENTARVTVEAMSRRERARDSAATGGGSGDSPLSP